MTVTERGVGAVVFDYAVFFLVIGTTLCLSFYNRIFGQNVNTKANYVFSTASKISSGAMLLSFARATLGVRSFLGYPSELYYHGVEMYETLYGYVLAYPIVAYLFLPVYFHLGITSVYQYLDLRFKSQAVRMIASGTYLLRNILTLGVTIFTPCVALKTIVGFPYWLSITGIGAISILCAVVGGMKAVILGDVVQGSIMILCALSIIIRGTLDVGSIENIIDTNYQHGRLDFFNFDLDPTKRVTTISAFFGQLFISMSIFGCQQNFVQRMCSMKSMKKIQTILWMNIPVIFILFTLTWTVGLVIYAYYVNCDPMTVGYTSKIDEIVPFFIQDKFRYIPGMLGLFMATLFNGGLSLSVSNINSMSTVSWEDFLSKIPYFREFGDTYQLLVIKFMAVVFGLLSMGIAFCVVHMSGVIDSSQIMSSTTSGPLLGVFSLAMYFPGCNWKGAVAGMVISHSVSLWITIGSRTIDKPYTYLPVTASGCTNESFSPHIYEIYGELSTEMVSRNFSRVTHPQRDRDILTQIYSTSYMYYSLIGCVICIVSGLLVSKITGSEEDEIYDEALIHPLAMKLSKLFPGKPRRYHNGTVTMEKEPKATSTGQDVKETKPSEQTTVPRYSAFGDEFPFPALVDEARNRAKPAPSLETITSKLSDN